MKMYAIKIGNGWVKSTHSFKPPNGDWIDEVIITSNMKQALEMHYVRAIEWARFLGGEIILMKEIKIYTSSDDDITTQHYYNNLE